MARPDRWARRVAVFFAAFSLLVAPWPGLGAAYGSWMRGLAGAAFRWGHPGWEVSLGPIPPTPSRPLDTRITLVDSAHLLANGRLRAIEMDLDLNGIARVPTAFFLALILATPGGWLRRCRAAAYGSLGLHLFILLSLGIHILRYEDTVGGIGIVDLGVSGRALVAGLDETLINQIGPGFFATAFLWVVVAFRRSDWKGLMSSRSGTFPEGPAPGMLRGRDNAVIQPDFG